MLKREVKRKSSNDMALSKLILEMQFVAYLCIWLAVYLSLQRQLMLHSVSKKNQSNPLMLKVSIKLLPR